MTWTAKVFGTLEMKVKALKRSESKVHISRGIAFNLEAHCLSSSVCALVTNRAVLATSAGRSVMRFSRSGNTAYGAREDFFFQVTAPTGRDVNESTAAFQLDARGRGFWSTALGSILTKTYRKFDFFVSLDVHRSYEHHFSNSQASGELHPGWGGNASIGGGYSLQSLRFGGGLAWAYEDPVRATGDLSSAGSPQRFATGTLTVAYLLKTAKNDMSTSLVYSDQTWLGEPNNTTLGRGLSLNLQKRWPR